MLASQFSPSKCCTSCSASTSSVPVQASVGDRPAVRVGPWLVERANPARTAEIVQRLARTELVEAELVQSCRGLQHKVELGHYHVVVTFHAADGAVATPDHEMPRRPQPEPHAPTVAPPRQRTPHLPARGAAERGDG